MFKEVNLDNVQGTAQRAAAEMNVVAKNAAAEMNVAAKNAAAEMNVAAKKLTGEMNDAAKKLSGLFGRTVAGHKDGPEQVVRGRPGPATCCHTSGWGCRRRASATTHVT